MNPLSRNLGSAPVSVVILNVKKKNNNKKKIKKKIKIHLLFLSALKYPITLCYNCHKESTLNEAVLHINQMKNKTRTVSELLTIQH